MQILRTYFLSQLTFVINFYSLCKKCFKLAGNECCALCSGVWGIGVATQKVNLNQVPMGRDTNSLVLRHDGSVYHNNEEKNRLPANSLPQEGDIVVSSKCILIILNLGLTTLSLSDLSVKLKMKNIFLLFCILSNI